MLTGVQYIYLPVTIASTFRYEDASELITEYISKKLKLKIESFHRTIRAVEPTNEERADLHLSYEVPLLELESVGYLTDGRPFCLIVSRYPGHLFEYRSVDPYAE